MNYRTTKGAKKAPGFLCVKALGYSLFRWLVLPSIQSLDRTQLVVVAQESSLLKGRCFPFLEKFHPVNNGSPQYHYQYSE